LKTSSSTIFPYTTLFRSAIQKFAREFQANVEPIAIFTSMGSPMFRQFRGQHNLRLFTFSAKTSTPSKVSEEHVLLPERDTSLLLDAIDKLLQANHGRLVGEYWIFRLRKQETDRRR